MKKIKKKPFALHASDERVRRLGKNNEYNIVITGG
jgi:hypothetical protein